MWNDGNKRATLKSRGDGVDIEDFGGEGTGIKSMKQVDWKPNQKVEFELKGSYNYQINGWNVECKVKINKKTHVMATFQRAGDEHILDSFKFHSFVEDFNRGQSVDGCLYERSADFFDPKIQYREGGRRKTVKLTKGKFTKDQNARQGFCSDWSCADSGRNFFSMTTGGSRLGKPERTCEHNKILHFKSTSPNSDGTGPLKFCAKKRN